MPDDLTDGATLGPLIGLKYWAHPNVPLSFDLGATVFLAGSHNAWYSAALAFAASWVPLLDRTWEPYLTGRLAIWGGLPFYPGFLGLELVAGTNVYLSESFHLGLEAGALEGLALPPGEFSFPVVHAQATAGFLFR